MFYSIIGVIKVVLSVSSMREDVSGIYEPLQIAYNRAEAADESPIEELVETSETVEQEPYKRKRFSPVEKLVRAIDYVAEFVDMKMNKERLEMGDEGFRIRRGPCADQLRDDGDYVAGFIHCHTCYSSDGRMRPEDLIRLAYEKGAKIVAISDHVARPENLEEATKLYRGLEESFRRVKDEAKKYGVVVIPGIEYNIEPCGFVREDVDDLCVAAGHMGIYLPYDFDLHTFVELLCQSPGKTLDDFVELADEVHKMGGVVVANHLTQQDGIGEDALRYLKDAGAVDGVEDVNLGAGLIELEGMTESGEFVYYSDTQGLASIAAQDSHGIPQASVATMFDRSNLEEAVEGLELNSEQYFMAASIELLRQIREHETEIYVERRDFRFITSAFLEKLRIFHPEISTKLLVIGITSPDLFSTFFGRSFFRPTTTTPKTEQPKILRTVTAS